MRPGDQWNPVERAACHAARLAFGLATLVLWLTRRLYRSRLLLLSDLGYAVRAAEAIRRLGWALLKGKHD